MAVENRIWVIRADVAGRDERLTCYGASEIVNPSGNVVRQGLLQRSGMLVEEIEERGLGRRVCEERLSEAVARSPTRSNSISPADRSLTSGY
jgi:predicted amidohydrolase